jgi:hypothetical protein
MGAITLHPFVFMGWEFMGRKFDMTLTNLQNGARVDAFCMKLPVVIQN